MMDGYMVEPLLKDPLPKKKGVPLSPFRLILNMESCAKAAHRLALQTNSTGVTTQPGPVR